MKPLVTPHSKDNGPISHDGKYIDPKEQWEEETVALDNKGGQEHELSPSAFCWIVNESQGCREDGVLAGKLPFGFRPWEHNALTVSFLLL